MNDQDRDVMKYNIAVGSDHHFALGKFAASSIQIALQDMTTALKREHGGWQEGPTVSIYGEPGGDGGVGRFVTRDQMIAAVHEYAAEIADALMVYHEFCVDNADPECYIWGDGDPDDGEDGSMEDDQDNDDD